MTGGYHSLLSGDYYTSGLLVRGVGLAISCTGAYLALRCVSRARGCTGLARARWLILGGISAGAIAIWATDFIALLGLTVPGQSIRYSVPVTLLSLLAAVGVMCAALLITGLVRLRAAAFAGVTVIVGLGVAFTHYLGVAAIRMAPQISYDVGLLAVSVVIAILATAALLWSAARVRGPWPAIGGAVGVGVVVTGMHEAGLAAVRLSSVSGQAGTAVGGSSGATAGSLAVPLVLGLAVLLFLTSAAVALSPTEEAVRYDQSLLDTIRRRGRAPLDVTPLKPGSNARRDGATTKSSPPWTIMDLFEPSPRR